LRRFHYSMGTKGVQEWVIRRAPHFGLKLSWFLQHGYEPHLWQLAFHTLCDDSTRNLLMHRFLVAGRRGGKTLSAAWEVAYYALNPSSFHWDAHKVESDEPLHIWILVPDFASSGRAATRTFLRVLKQSGLVRYKDYTYNQTDKVIEFPNGTVVEFKTAQQPDNLVGAGIDILWMDETAIIPNKDAFEYASPALDDRLGIVIGTTTPRGKNWFYDLGWSPEAHKDEAIGTVEYTSIHNPYYSKERWLYRKRRYHPLKFKQEYMAAFDSLAGKDLSGDWLHTYEIEELPLKDAKLGAQFPDGMLRIANLDLDIFLGIDLAISLADDADHFACCVLGVHRKTMQVYIVDFFVSRLEFPDQVEFIQEMHMKWRPIYIGIESHNYQMALVQMARRLPTMPNISPQAAVGKKNDRIMSMSPNFKLGQVRIRGEFKDFIQQWVDFDSSRQNQKDDVLDATEIALRTAGVLLPGFPDETDTHPPATLEELAKARQPKAYNPMQEDWDLYSKTQESMRGTDEHMGDIW
jgi:phage terminase large subunit-like protein